TTKGTVIGFQTLLLFNLEKFSVRKFEIYPINASTKKMWKEMVCCLRLCNILLFEGLSPSPQAGKATGISEGEVEEINEIYSLAVCFQNAYIDQVRASDGTVVNRGAKLRWPFDKTEMRHYNEKYFESVLVSWYYEYEGQKEEYQKLKKEIKDEHILKFKHTHGRKLTMDTLNEFKSCFITTVMPKAAKVLKKIIQVVSTSSFNAAMKRLKGSVSSG
ncbi:hypothetical protein AKJ37_06500, partial [candidate division MSBL1 archaeon SCGC-AAA259I09]